MKPSVFTAIVVTSSFGLAPSILAQSYQSEINAHYGEQESDFYPSDNYSIGVEGRHYFAPVDTTRGPLAEAAFLQKASSFSLYLANSDYESYYQDGDAYFRGMRVTYFIPDSLFFVGAEVAETKSVFTYRYGEEYYPYENRFSSGWDTQWKGTLGIAPMDGLQIWSEFSEETDISEYWNLNAKYVKLLAGERAFSVLAAYADNEIFDVRSLTVDVDYYFTRRLSVGVGAARMIFSDSGADDDYESFVRARHFITENSSVDLTYHSADYSSRWQLGATVRF